MRPTSGPARPYRFPVVERFQASNGIRVAVAPIPRIPLVTLHVVVDAGAGFERTQEAGIAHLVSRGLAEGTPELSGDALAERFERLGSAVEPSADWESIELQSTVLASHLEETFGLTADLITRPAFREADVARIREERLAELLQRDTEPRELADDEFAVSLYQSGDRLQLPLGGERGSVRRLNHLSAGDWHRNGFAPQRASIIVAGDVTAALVSAMIEGTLGGWHHDSGKRTGSLSQPNAGAETHFVPLSQAAQSEIRIGHSGPPRRHPDYYGLTVMNAILGGLFGSRINLNLREKHGYTYGAFSSFAWRRDGSVFAISTAVGSDVTIPALAEIRSEVARIREEKVSSAELSLAVDHLEGVFPLRFETTSALASALAVQLVYELPVQYFDEYREHIRAVTANDVLRVAQEHLNPDLMHSVVVGNSDLRATIETYAGGRLVVRETTIEHHE